MRGLFNIRSIIMPLLLLGVVFFGWFLHRKREGDVFNELENFSGVEPSISSAKAMSFANDLYNAMEIFGTKVNLIESVVDTCNPEDWRLVHNAFGKKRYFLTGRNDFLGYERNLKYWLRSELGFGNKKLIRKIKNLYHANGEVF